jgi:hypothetical protein
MMRHAVRTCVAVLVVVSSVGSHSGRAEAQTRPAKPVVTARPLAQALTGQAKADYEAGKTLAGDGDFAGALIKFQSAYDQSKDPRLLWNVAYCDKNLRHYARVIATLNRYVAEGTGFLSDKDRKDATDLIATLQPFTTNATFKVSEDGALITVDDAPVGTSPLPTPVVLDIGERHIRVTKDGFKPFEKSLPVGGSASVDVNVMLEREVHEGHLVVNAPPDAALVLDDKPVGTGKIDMNVAAGGHQLRATAPGMRPYQTEIVVQDKETRQIDVALEKEPEPEQPKLRVAVGCDGPEPRGPEDGLVVYLDGPDVLPPLSVKKKWDEAESRNVVEYVEYAVPAGNHTVRARIPDCVSLETTVGVDPHTGAAISGALETDTPLLMQGPQGTPGHWRIGAGLWLFNYTDSYLTKDMPEAYKGGLTTGFAVGGAFVGRWFGLFLHTAYGSGSMQRSTFNTNDALPATTHLDVYQTAVRASFRVPFNAVSWNLIGAEAGVAVFNLQSVNTGQVQGMFGPWTGLDIQPFCDWGASVSAELQILSDTEHSGAGIVGQFGLFYEPNSRCRRERATEFGLRSGLGAQ